MEASQLGWWPLPFGVDDQRWRDFGWHGSIVAKASVGIIPLSSTMEGQHLGVEAILLH